MRCSIFVVFDSPKNALQKAAAACVGTWRRTVLLLYMINEIVFRTLGVWSSHTVEPWHNELRCNKIYDLAEYCTCHSTFPVEHYIFFVPQYNQSVLLQFQCNKMPVSSKIKKNAQEDNLVIEIKHLKAILPQSPAGLLQADGPHNVSMRGVGEVRGKVHPTNLVNAWPTSHRLAKNTEK